MWQLVLYYKLYNGVVVVVRFGDPCESPGALPLTAAPGYVEMLLHDQEFPEQCNKFFVLSCCL